MHFTYWKISLHDSSHQNDIKTKFNLFVFMVYTKKILLAHTITLLKDIIINVHLSNKYQLKLDWIIKSAQYQTIVY